MLLEYLSQNQYSQQKYYEYFLGDTISISAKTPAEYSFLTHLLPLSIKEKKQQNNTHYIEPLIKNSGLQQSTPKKFWLNYRIPVVEFLPTPSSIFAQSNISGLENSLEKIKQNASTIHSSTATLKLRDWKWIYLILLLIFISELIAVYLRKRKL